MLSQGAPVSAALGQLGSTLFNDTTAKTGQWGEIYCLSAAAFTLLTPGKLADGTTSCVVVSSGGTLMSAIGTMAAGTHIKGLFTAITLASGTVIAYNV